MVEPRRTLNSPLTTWTDCVSFHKDVPLVAASHTEKLMVTVASNGFCWAVLSVSLPW